MGFSRYLEVYRILASSCVCTSCLHSFNENRQMRRTGFKRRPTSPLKRTPLRPSSKVSLRRGKKLRKEGKSSVSILKRKLWKVFATFIKKRDGNICFTCGRKGEGSGIHAGHFINKSVGGAALYFHEENVHAQCYNCNINLGGNQYVYGEKLGKETVERLRRLKLQIFKPTEEWYEDMIEDYSTRK